MRRLAVVRIRNAGWLVHRRAMGGGDFQAGLVVYRAAYARQAVLLLRGRSLAQERNERDLVIVLVAARIALRIVCVVAVVAGLRLLAQVVRD